MRNKLIPYSILLNTLLVFSCDDGVKPSVKTEKEANSAKFDPQVEAENNQEIVFYVTKAKLVGIVGADEKVPAPEEDKQEEKPDNNGSGGDDLAASIAAYTSTLYPLVQQSCSGATCHDTAGHQAPFALDNTTTAHNAALASGRVNLSNPNASVMITQINNGHNVQAGDIQTLSQSFLEQINAWNASIE